jgi:hypothetical protein
VIVSGEDTGLLTTARLMVLDASEVVKTGAA